MTLPKITTNCSLDCLVQLLNTPSPTGYTEQAIDLVEQQLKGISPLQLWRTRKGGLMVKWDVAGSSAPRALTAHVDTLGAMVKEIKPNGRLAITRIGGLNLNAVETEGCWVFTSRGGKLRGSLLVHTASGHVYGPKATETPRDEEHMEIRLDARTTSAKETRSLDVAPGDFVAFDPRVEVTNGFIRSRHLDDKAGVAAIVSAIKSIAEAGMVPRETTYILFSNYEEVGHGAASGIPADVHELVTVDMAAVGDGQDSDEFHATLCLKDTGGPYHHGLSNKLRELAERYAIPYKTDIYPYYGSDGEAFWRAGADVAVALIGPGIDASHNYERTHTEALVATTNWIIAYMLGD
jgi:putative aminopeptidase FrvX